MISKTDQIDYIIQFTYALLFTTATIIIITIVFQHPVFLSDNFVMITITLLSIFTIFTMLFRVPIKWQ